MRTLHLDKTVDGVSVTMAPLNEVEMRCVEWASNWCIKNSTSPNGRAQGHRPYNCKHWIAALSMPR